MVRYDAWLCAGIRFVAMYRGVEQMRFPTMYSEKKPFFSNPGSQFKDEKQLAIDDEGHEYLAVIGRTDVTALIQQDKDMVDIYTILDRYANGYEDALNKVQGFYADVSNLPSSFSEIMNMNIRGEMLFRQLPPEIRDVYGNNYMTFMNEPNRALEKFGKKEIENTVSKKDEVVADDNS